MKVLIIVIGLLSLSGCAAMNEAYLENLRYQNSQPPAPKPLRCETVTIGSYATTTCN